MKNKIVFLLNFAPHYREFILKKIDQELNADLYFGNIPNSSIKKLDYNELRNFKKELNVRHIKNEKLKIVCSGNLKKPRNPENFVLALSKLIKEYRNISVDIIGVYEDSLNDMILENKLSDFVKLLPPISYKQSLEVLEQYDVALIIEADCEEGIFLPTKVGDYMQYEKVIFSISPQKGVLNDLYNDAYIQYFSANNIDDIYSELKKLYIDFSSNSIPIVQFNKEYSEENILKLYNRIIND